eukprot:9134950-Prorocentrum_lima.AAC.1
MLSADEDEETCQVQAHEARERSLTPQGRRRLEIPDQRQLPREERHRPPDLHEHRDPLQEGQVMSPSSAGVGGSALTGEEELVMVSQDELMMTSVSSMSTPQTHPITPSFPRV